MEPIMQPMSEVEYAYIQEIYEYLGGAGRVAGTGCGLGSRMNDDSVILTSDSDGAESLLELP
jgi:hypothetical protein